MSESGSKQRSSGVYTEMGRLIITVAQREAAHRAGTKSNVRPIHMLLAAARVEKSHASEVLESVGVTAQKLDAFLVEKGQPRDSEDGRPVLKPEARAVLAKCEELTTRWGLRYITDDHLLGALAENSDAEVTEAFAQCGTSGDAVMEALLQAMRESGRLKEPG